MQSPCVAARATPPSTVTPLYGKFLMNLKRALYLRLSLSSSSLSGSMSGSLTVAVFCHRDGSR